MKPPKLSLITISVFVALLAGFFISTCAFAEPLRKLLVFYSPGCHKCAQVKQEVMPVIESKYKDKVLVEYRNIGNVENYKLLLGLEKKYKVNLENILPVFYCEGSFLNGKGEVAQALEKLITASLFKPPAEEGILPQIDLVSRFKNFKPLVIISAGLIDGINPCAFTVIVFFISFLALQGYKKRELLIVGLLFIFAVLLTYILIGLGLFAFLYRIEGFWLVKKIVNTAIGVFSVILGILALYDAFKYRRTKATDGLILQLPGALKSRIHRVIGERYRKDSRAKGAESSIFRLSLGALATGFLVSLLEAVCTGQAYLPTIGFILKSSPLKLTAFTYLVVYNLVFIAPLLLIFIFALFGATSEHFSKFLKRHLLTVKLLMALLFFILGAFLLWG